MLRNTPASYKKEYPWLKEVDSLALANDRCIWKAHSISFFVNHLQDFRVSNQRSRQENLYNKRSEWKYLSGRNYLKLPKMTAVRMKLHRPISEKWKLKSVTVSREPSGKYFASLLFCSENQAAEKRPAEKFIGIDFAMQGMCVFSTGERAGYPMFYRKAEKNLQGNRESFPTVKKEAGTIRNRRKRLLYIMKR